jgi:hypothetical protein
MVSSTNISCRAKTTGDRSVKLDWNVMRTILNDDEYSGDKLEIIDSCYASTAAVGSNLEILAATGVWDLALNSALNASTFTDRMITQMKSFDGLFNVAQLHSHLMDPRRVTKEALKITPIHIARHDRAVPSTCPEWAKQ